MQDVDVMKVYIAPCKVLRNKEFPNFDKCTLSTNNFVCSCLVSLYLIHAPLFFLVTKVEMQLLILTLWLSAELFEIMLRQVNLGSISLHTINVWGSNSTIWEIVYFI